MTSHKDYSKNYKISFVEQLPKDIEEKMEKGLLEYEISHGVDVNYKPFSSQ